MKNKQSGKIFRKNNFCQMFLLQNPHLSKIGFRKGLLQLCRKRQICAHNYFCTILQKWQMSSERSHSCRGQPLQQPIGLGQGSFKPFVMIVSYISAQLQHYTFIPFHHQQRIEIVDTKICTNLTRIIEGLNYCTPKMMTLQGQLLSIFVLPKGIKIFFFSFGVTKE